MGPNYAGTVLTNLSLFLKFLIHTHSYIYKHIPQNTQVWGFRSKRMCYAHSPWKPLKKIKKVNDKNGSSLGWLLWNCVYISQRANFWVALNFLQMFGTVRGIDIIPLDAYPPIWSCLITGLDCLTRLFVHITWPPHHQICWIWSHQLHLCCCKLHFIIPLHGRERIHECTVHKPHGQMCTVSSWCRVPKMLKKATSLTNLLLV